MKIQTSCWKDGEEINIPITSLISDYNESTVIKREPLTDSLKPPENFENPIIQKNKKTDTSMSKKKDDSLEQTTKTLDPTRETYSDF